MNAPATALAGPPPLRFSLIRQAVYPSLRPRPVRLVTVAGLPRRHDLSSAAGIAPSAPPGVSLQAVKGTEAGWQMPVAICEAPDGYDTSCAPHAPDCHVVEWHLAPAKVERVLPSGHMVEALLPNGFLLRPAGVPLPMVATGPARFAHFRIPDGFLRAVAVDWAGDSADCDALIGCERLMRTDPAIVPMLDAYVRRAMDEEEPPTRLEMDSRAHLIVLQILKRHSALVERQQRVRRGGLAPYQLRRVCELMTRDLAEEIPLAELAGKIGVSYHHFCHAFKISTGTPPRQWLVERRVDAACELLRTTRLSVTEISGAVGYDDPNQLLRVFRSRRGTTPGAYRRQFQDIDGLTPAPIPPAVAAA